MKKSRDEAAPKTPSKLAQEVKEVARYLWNGVSDDQSQSQLLQTWVQLRVEEMRFGKSEN